MRTIINVGLFLLAGLCYSQENIPIENWRLHVSYNNITSLALAGDVTYAASSNGLFYFNRTDNSVKTITKINGLSDVGISVIAYDDPSGVLVIGYSNGNLDLLYNEEIININIIKEADILDSKKINQVLFYNHQGYLSTDFGVLILDLSTLSLSESLTNLGLSGGSIKINDGAVIGDSIVLATQEGIIASAVDNGTNLLDFNNWKRYGVSENAPLGSISQIEVHDSQLYATASGDGIYRYNGSQWIKEPFLTNENYKGLFSQEDNLIVTIDNHVWALINNTLTEIVIGTTSPNLAQIDGSGAYWVADRNNGVLTNISGEFQSIKPSGPLSDNSWELYYHNNNLFSLPGGIDENDLPLGKEAGFSVFTNGFWKNYISPTLPADLVDMAYLPSTDNYIIGTYGSGIVTYDGQSQFKIIDNNSPNSPLESYTGGRVYIPSISQEGSGAWITNYGTSHSLHFFDNNTWESYSLPSAVYPKGVSVASNGDKWIWLSPNEGGGVYVFNENSGKGRLLNSNNGNGGLPNTSVYHVAFDKEWVVWIGTSRGLAYFSSTNEVDNNNFINAFTPIINGFPVLRDEEITVIQIDGGNRKWIGTNNGVWLFDANVQNQIHNFNTENSPLLSNVILDIGINPSTGEVFFATSKGIASFRSNASEGDSTHTNIKIFPNPVDKDFQGKVGIFGLTNNAIVKITDVSGRLIRQMKANGASTSWDVNNYQGNRVSTGTYFVFSSSEDGVETYIGKIAVVN